MSNLQPLEFKECVVDSPWFREKLLLHEREINYSVKVFKDIYNSIKNVYKTLEDCSVAFQELADNLRKFTSSSINNETETNDIQAETDDEKKIRSALDIYSDLISSIETMRREHILGVTKDLILTDLQRLKEDCLYRSKQDIKDFKKTTANYYSKLDRYSSTKCKSDQEYENVDTEFLEDRRQYATKALTHVMNIQETEEQKNCKLVHALSLLIQMLNTFHHQAWDHFGDQKKKTDEVNCALYRTEESYTAIAENTGILKQQLLTLPIEHIQPDFKSAGIVRREGYLFVFTKKAVMADMWCRRFCVYEKNSRVFSMIQVPTNGAKMQSERYELISCERKKSNTIERRFSFDVKMKNVQFPLTLQALTKEDLKQWLLIMDGQEPIYALPRDPQMSLEPETILNERTFQFLSICFSEIEKRGMTIEGVYRMSGRTGLRDSILKKMIIDAGNAFGEFTSTGELEDVDILTLCCTIKAYLKYLKVPMATYVLYDEFIAAGKMNNSYERFHEVLKVVKKLPPDHFKLFAIVMRHLHKVTEHQEKNRMTAPNLGVCFSPTIFRPEEGNASLTAIRESKFAADVISLLIERYEEFFPVSSTRTILAPSKLAVVRKTDPKVSPDNTQARLERINTQIANISPKSGVRRIQSTACSMDVRPGPIKPPFLSPKPDIAKLMPQLSNKSLVMENKIPQIDGSNTKNQRIRGPWLANRDY